MIINNNKYINVNNNEYSKTEYFKKIIKLKFNITFPKNENEFFINLLMKN